MAHILVVDDQSSILVMLESLLTKHGHTVATATNSIDAIDRMYSEPVDMVITDAIMPMGTTGYELVQTLRKNSKFEKLPMILLTGKREKQDIERGISSGVDDYVVKPVDPDLFVAKVDSLLKKRNRDTPQFTEVATSVGAEWKVKLKIVSVSEIGLTLRSELPATVGAKVSIESEFFSNLAIASPKLRVIGCSLAGGENPSYIITTHYIGMTESSLQPLRIWIRSQKVRRTA